MNKWLAALGVLLVTGGAASADYVVIIANLRAPAPQPDKGKEGGMIGMIGGGPPGGLQIGGGPPGGMQIGGGPPGGIQIGGPPGGMQKGGPPGGMQIGGPGGGAFGMQIGGPGGGRIGGGPPGGAFGGPPGGGGVIGADPDAEPDEEPYLIVVALEVTSSQPHKGKYDYAAQFDAGHPVTFKHRFGTIKLVKSNSNAQVKLFKKPTVLREFQSRYDKLLKDTRDKPPAGDLLEFARWTLERGLVSRFEEIMAKLAEVDGKHAAVTSYQKIKADLDKGAKRGEQVATWQRRAVGYNLSELPRGHYTLLHKGAENGKEAQTQLTRLEDSFRAFYYWWALEGVVLRVPPDRQVAVFTDSAPLYETWQARLTASPPHADSFHARRENAIVFASKRSDSPYANLESVAQPLWTKGFNRTELLTGKLGFGVPLSVGPDPRTREQSADGPRLAALLLKAMEQEQEQTAASHAASRQLLFASGVLPGNVAVPEWVQFGMGSFFETPLQSPTPRIGLPSTYWLPRFNEMKKKGRLEPNAAKTLRAVVTDGYFRDVPAKAEGHEPELRVARATAWSLTYFLAKRERERFQRYLQHLGRMPRDVELSDEVLLRAFERAFCSDPGRSVEEQLNSLATRWYGFMTDVRLESEDIHAEVRKAFATMAPPPSGAPSTPRPGGGGGGRPPIGPGGGPRPR